MFYNLVLILLNLLNNLLGEESFSQTLGDSDYYQASLLAICQSRTNITSQAFHFGLMILIHFAQPYVIFVWIQWLISVIHSLLGCLQGLVSTWIFGSWLHFYPSLFVFREVLSIWSMDCLLAPLSDSRLKKKKNVNHLLICGFGAQFLLPHMYC